jgi:hypothetical protein
MVMIMVMVTHDDDNDDDSLASVTLCDDICESKQIDYVASGIKWNEIPKRIEKRRNGKWAMIRMMMGCKG